MILFENQSTLKAVSVQDREDVVLDFGRSGFDSSSVQLTLLLSVHLTFCTKNWGSSHILAMYAVELKNHMWMYFMETYGIMGI